MKISTKGRYGMQMMDYLAKNAKDSPVPLSDIASGLDLPEAYLEQLMRKLKQNDFVTSVRGAHGGYLLARDPEDISVLDILECLEDGITITDCSEEGFTECSKTGQCASRLLWMKIDNAVFKALADYSLKDLANEEKLEKEA